MKLPLGTFGGAKRISWALMAGLVLVFFWLLACAWYIDFAVGWQNLLYFLPQELAMVALGVSGPMVVIWLVVLVLTRRGHQDRQTQEIVTRIEALLTKAVGEGATNNRLSESLRCESEALAAAGAGAAAKLQPLLDGLEQKNQALAATGGKARETLQGLQNELLESTKSLAGDSEALGVLLRENRKILADQEEGLSSFRESVDETLSAFEDRAERAFEALDGRLAATSEGGQSLIADLSDGNDRLGERFASLREEGENLIKAAKDEALDLARIGEQMAALTSTAVERLRQHETLLAEGLTRNLARSETLCATLRQESERLGAMTSSLTEETERLSGRLEDGGKELAEQLNQATNQGLSRFSELEKRGREIADQLTAQQVARFETLQESAESFTLAWAEKLTAAGQKAEQSLSAFGAQAEETVGSFAELGADRLEELSGKLESERDQLVTSIQSAAQGVATALQALEARSEGLESKIATSGQEQLEALEGAFAKAGRLLSGQGEQLRQSAERIAALTEEAEESRGALESHIASQDHDLRDRLQSLTDAIQASGESLSQTAETAGGAIEQTLRKLAAEGAHLEKALAQTQDKSGQIQDLLANERQAANSLQEEMNQTLEGLARRLEAQRQALQAAADSSQSASATFLASSAVEMERLDLVQRDAKKNLIALRSDASKAIDELAQSIEDTRHTAKALGEELKQRGERIESAMRETHSRGEDITKALAQQTEDLARASKSAQKHLEELKDQHEQSQRDAFLRSATLLIEDLNSLSVDMVRLLEDDIPEEVWKRYRKGDRSVFARRLLRMGDPFSVSAVERRYREDDAFRLQASRFMGQFENLLAQASQCDSDQVLNAAFLTADVGKVYLLLSRSLGREQ